MNMLGLHDYEKLICNEKKFTDYDDDLYKFYHLEESQIRANSKGFKVDFQMRMNVVDWLIQTHYEQKLMPETLYLCVNILDRVLSKIKFEVTTMDKLKLIGLSSLLLASKYEQRSAVGVYDVEYMADYIYMPEEICQMEKLILQELGWILTVPTPYVFLVRNMRACLLSDQDKIMENMVFFFSELSLTNQSIVCDYKPSMIAACSVYCARFVVGRYPFWSNDLKMCTGYSEEKLLSCANVMIKSCSQICGDGIMEVFKKFSSLYQSRVSCIAQEYLDLRNLY
ncbi:putative cyclin D [Medicago truncatula]|uniref:B-like cyclin n=1 Tax=Medicago truncatula TaxID=3880 RepID=G7J270_MEDTR|nr:carboxy-terminal domain cyclin [Medicago truncatula]RHN67510.1 putative cyclin D [Medicago truncatula]